VVCAAAFARDNESSRLPRGDRGLLTHVFLIIKLYVRNQTAMNLQSAFNADVGIFSCASVGREPIRPMDQFDVFGLCAFTESMQNGKFIQ
jgi:hypothetical protein